MAQLGELPMRQHEAFLPDPLRDTAFVPFEHAVQVAQRHGHVVCDGLSVEIAFSKMFSDETLSPQEAQGHDVVASGRTMPPRFQEQPQPRPHLAMHGRCQHGQRVVHETQDPAAISEHGKRGGFPVNKVAKVAAMIGPATARA